MDTEAHSPEVKESHSSFRKPANEMSRRNYRRHSPSTSRSPSPPSPAGWKRDRSPSHAVRDGGGSKRERRPDTENDVGRGDVGCSRRGIDDHRTSSRSIYGRSDDNDHAYNQKHVSYNGRGHHSSRDSRADSHWHDERRYSKRSPPRGVRDRKEDESRYRRRETPASERDRDRHDRSDERDRDRHDRNDVRDRHRNRDRGVHSGRDRPGMKRTDDASHADFDRYKHGKRVENGGAEDGGMGKGQDTDKREREKPKPVSESLREETDNDTHHQSKDGKGEKHKRKLDENTYEGNEYLKEIARGEKNIIKKEDTDKKIVSEPTKQLSSSFESTSVPMDKCVAVASETYDESRKLASGMDEKLPKGTKWDSQAGPLDGVISSSDPEAAKAAALKAAQQVSINLGGFKSVDEKKKMLWKSKAQEPSAASATIRWDTVQFADDERREKFKKLMGVKGAAVEEGPKTGGGVSGVFTSEKQEEIQQGLEKQYTAGLRRRDGRTVGLGL